MQRDVAQLRSPVYTARYSLRSKAMMVREEFDPQAPQREAALFYGLFLRGHSPDVLRRDIEIPRKLVLKLLQRHRNERELRAKVQRVYLYRKQVLAIFDELVTREQSRARVN